MQLSICLQIRKSKQTQEEREREREKKSTGPIASPLPALNIVPSDFFLFLTFTDAAASNLLFTQSSGGVLSAIGVDKCGSRDQERICWGLGIMEDVGSRKRKKKRKQKSEKVQGGNAAVSGTVPVMIQKKKRPGSEVALHDSGKKRKKQGQKNEVKKNDVRAGAVESASPATQPRGAAKSLSFVDKMRARLVGGQFRMLNETLYTCRGEDAFKLFQKDSNAFQLYHTGYQEQMSHWPRLPVQVVMDWLKAHRPNLVVADFGCGDARLAKGVKNKVYSLDLIACDDTVIACNMAKTPLETASVDVAVFCLSLMGVDYPSFLKEAHRVLKMRGSLLIAEVKSRFDAANGGAEPDQFVEALKGLGFSLVSQDANNKMFIMFVFQKQGEKTGKKLIDWPDLKACVYKKR